MSARVQLKIAISEHPQTLAILDGSIPIEGVDAEFITVGPQIGACGAVAGEVECEVCELEPTSYLIARSQSATFIGTPIFAIRRAEDSRPRFQTRVRTWARQMLIDEFGFEARGVGPSLDGGVDAGRYPIQGIVVVKDSLLAEHPWIAQSIYDAFERARKQWLVQLRANQDLGCLVLTKFIGHDPLPFWSWEAA